MKILSLRFKNLNSLYGEWNIDFTKPEFTSSGIFAITGSTGAGKSTILDAISLALYGQTPRLGKITKGGNDLMSRQTGECLSEVVFETRQGQYKCYWEQHRAKKKPEGQLTEPKREFSEALSGKILGTKKKDFESLVEEKTGMDYQRFSQSILLSQGGFAAFLKASSDDRALIFEQITGTGIYSEISRLVHERNKTEKDKIQLIEKETSSIVLLTKEEDDELRSQIQAGGQKESSLKLETVQIDESLRWLETIAQLKKALEQVNHQSLRLKGELEIFKTDRERLARAVKASEIEGELGILSHLEIQQEADTESLNSLRIDLPKRQEEKNKAEVVFKQAQEEKVQERNKQKVEAETIKTIRDLDGRLKEKSNALKALQEESTRLENSIALQRAKHRDLESQNSQVQRALSLTEDYLINHSEDERLIGELETIKEKFSTYLKTSGVLRIKRGQIKALKEKILLNNGEIEKKVILSQDFEIQYAKDQALLHETKQKLEVLLGGSLLREYKNHLEELHKEEKYVRTIGQLTEERAHLKDGEACPLCGSREHPFALGNIPQVGEIQKKIIVLREKIDQAERLSEKIDLLKKEDNEKRIQKIEIEKDLAYLRVRETEFYENLNALVQEEKNEVEEEKKQGQSISTQISFFGFDDSDDPIRVIKTLEGRLLTWKTHSDEKIRQQEKIQNLSIELKGLSSVLTSQAEDMDQRKNKISAAQEEISHLDHKRVSIYAHKNPDQEERRLESLVELAEEKENQSRKKMEDSSLVLEELKTRMAALEEKIQKAVPQVSRAQADFREACWLRGFKDREDYLAWSLPLQKRSLLTQRAEELDTSNLELKVKQKDLEFRLEAEVAKVKTGETKDFLLVRKETIEKNLAAVQEEKGALQERLSSNETAKFLLEGKKDVLLRQKDISEKWANLHQLIGSSDGKKFRNFAQGLTFEIMVIHANVQLEKMSDRYLLVRDEQNPLELNVIDNYQAGEIRSSKNLSGGESFIVSLALSLGLSKMASRRVRVDSLFLDEGFGTLDDEALETALETLSGLQQEGKIIGIISHVSALKERIGTQILVQPNSGGRSILIGPGCKKMDQP